jgi:hypothetical protein
MATPRNARSTCKLSISGRFLNGRLAGMYARHPGHAPVQPPAKFEARVRNRTLKHKPVDGSTHRSSYKLAAQLDDVSVSAMQRIWRRHGIKPQRLERHMISNDPDFKTKAADMIGLYLNPSRAGGILSGWENRDRDT